MQKIIIIPVTIVYVFIFVVLLLNATYPKKIWRIFDGWKATSEPTDVYFRTRRIMSIIGLLIFLFIMAGPIFISLLDK